MTSPSPEKLDSGAKGGLAGLAVVAAGFVALAAAYTIRPWICGSAMALIGGAFLVATWRIAVNRRRYFSPVLWLSLSLMLISALGILQAAATDELWRYWAEDPSRKQNVLLTVAVLAGVSIISFWMLRRGRRKDRPE